MRVSLGLLFAFGACLSRGEPTLAGQKSHLAMGRDLYRENCAVCHDIERDKAHSRKFGPSLNHLFKNPTLPMSHGKPSRQYVEIRIKFGGAFMPAFGKRLTQDEINTLIDYIDSK
jgi:mono/diheme cytochrome c family protein